MLLKMPIGFLTACLAFGAADKKLPLEKSSNELVEIAASVILDREQLKQEVGVEVPVGVIAVRVIFRTMSEKPVKIDRDDFALLDVYGGQRSTPYSPSQIAGNGTLVVGSMGTRGSMTGAGNGPRWGIPGIGGGGGRLPGNGGGVGATGGPEAATATVKSDPKSQESPLLQALKDKVLPEKEITESATGLLYFQMDGKVKAKDLELYYRTPAGKLSLRFRP